MQDAVDIPYHFSKNTVESIRYLDFALFISLMFIHIQLKRKYPDLVNNEQVRSYVLDQKNKPLLEDMYKIQIGEDNKSQQQSKSVVTQVEKNRKQHNYRYFTNWNLYLNFIYLFLTTFVFNITYDTPITLAVFIRLHFMCYSLQAFILVIYFTALCWQIRKVLFFLPKSRLFVNECVHFVPFIIMFIECFLWDYKLGICAVFIPTGFTLIYFIFNVFIYTLQDVVVYPQLDYKKKITFLWIFIFLLFCIGIFYLALLSRGWVNSMFEK